MKDQKGHEREEELVCKWGCGKNIPIRWANGTLYTTEGESTMCKCGKLAERAIIGKEAFLARCDQ